MKKTKLLIAALAFLICTPKANYASEELHISQEFYQGIYKTMKPIFDQIEKQNGPKQTQIIQRGANEFQTDCKTFKAALGNRDLLFTLPGFQRLMFPMAQITTNAVLQKRDLNPTEKTQMGNLLIPIVARILGVRDSALKEYLMAPTQAEAQKLFTPAVTPAPVNTTADEAHAKPVYIAKIPESVPAEKREMYDYLRDDLRNGKFNRFADMVRNTPGQENNFHLADFLNNFQTNMTNFHTKSVDVLYAVHDLITKAENGQEGIIDAAYKINERLR